MGKNSWIIKQWNDKWFNIITVVVIVITSWVNLSNKVNSRDAVLDKLQGAIENVQNDIREVQKDTALTKQSQSRSEKDIDEIKVALKNLGAQVSSPSTTVQTVAVKNQVAVKSKEEMDNKEQETVVFSGIVDNLLALLIKR